MDGAPTLGIMIPCYNEEKVLPETRRQTVALVGDLIGILSTTEAGIGLGR